MIIENPKITITELNEIEQLVKSNTAKVDHYERLDDYLSFIGLKNYLSNKIKKAGIEGFADFIYERNNQTTSPLNNLVGTVLGIISFLKNYVSGK